MPKSTEDVLYELDENLQLNGYPPMDAATLKETHKHLSHPQVQQQLQSGQLTIERLVAESLEALKGIGFTPNAQGAMNRPIPQPSPPGKILSPAPSGAMPPYVEGGFVNDRSGQATRKMRQQYRRR